MSRMSLRGRLSSWVCASALRSSCEIQNPQPSQSPPRLNNCSNCLWARRFRKPQFDKTHRQIPVNVGRRRRVSSVSESWTGVAPETRRRADEFNRQLGPLPSSLADVDDAALLFLPSGQVREENPAFELHWRKQRDQSAVKTEDNGPGLFFKGPAITIEPANEDRQVGNAALRPPNTTPARSGLRTGRQGARLYRLPKTRKPK